MSNISVTRAIEILTPDSTRYTPAEYAEALRMARTALEEYSKLESGEYKIVRRDD